jgi:hypothetical protein
MYQKNVSKKCIKKMYQKNVSKMSCIFDTGVAWVTGFGRRT